MWSYYGSKFKTAKLYPKPLYPLIIEPFAGAAWYSVLHSGHKVLLNDSYKVIYRLWDWLITTADKPTILAYTNFYKGQNIKHLRIKQPHRDLIGFCINRGSAAPKNTVQKWSCQVAARPNWASTTAHQLKRVADLLPGIKHWKVQFGDYTTIPNQEATWFIDPPYQFGGRYYSKRSIDYVDLMHWCKTRKGQVIVCENTKADWLPFKPLTEIRGQKFKTIEAVWLQTN